MPKEKTYTITIQLTTGEVEYAKSSTEDEIKTLNNNLVEAIKTNTPIQTKTPTNTGIQHHIINQTNITHITITPTPHALE